MIKRVLDFMPFESWKIHLAVIEMAKEAAISKCDRLDSRIRENPNVNR